MGLKETKADHRVPSAEFKHSDSVVASSIRWHTLSTTEEVSSLPRLFEGSSESIGRRVNPNDPVTTPKQPLLRTHSMKVIRHWLAQRRTHEENRERILEIEGNFGDMLGFPICIKPAPSKGGYDLILHAYRENEMIAVVRLNQAADNRQQPEHDPSALRVPLAGDKRLQLEWDAYTTLAPMGLSPKALWQADDAIACEFVPWTRASRLLIKNRKAVLPLATHIFEAIAQMHEGKLVHLDLNLGNILVSNDHSQVRFIDFEYGRAEATTIQQAMAYDYLKVVDDFMRPRRGGRVLAAKLDELSRTLDSHVPQEIRNEDLSLIMKTLKRIPHDPCMREALTPIFPGVKL